MSESLVSADSTLAEGLCGDEKIAARFWFTVSEAVNPGCSGISTETAVWAEQLGLGDPALRTEIIGGDVGSWAARALPRSAPETVRLLSDFLFWFFVLDDEYCDKRREGSDPVALAELLPLLIRVAEQPATPILAGNPLAEGLRDITQRIAAQSSAHFPVEFAHGLSSWFLAILWEAHHQERDTQASVEDYVLLCSSKAAIRVFCMLAELGGCEQLTTAERDAPAVRALVEMAGFVQICDNDVLSYDKERREQHYNLTAITALQAHHGLPLAQAVAEVISWHDSALTRFTEVHDHVAANSSPALTDFLANLESMIRATFDWQARTSRYVRADGIVRVQATEEPPTKTGRLPFAATAWWWDSTLTTEIVRS